MSISNSLSSVPARLTLLALFSATTFYCLYKSRRLRYLKLSLNPNPKPKPKIIFLSETGTSKTLTLRLHRLLASNGVAFDVVDSRHYEPEDLPKETLLILVASTWQDGAPPDASRFFATWLAEASADFRAGSLLLSSCRVAVFGVGSRAYGESFNAVAKGLATHLRALGAKEVVPLCEGDVDGGDLDKVFDRWCEKVLAVLKGGGVAECDDGDGGGALDYGVYSSSEEESDVESEIVDLEDIASKAPSRRKTLGKRVMGN